MALDDEGTSLGQHPTGLDCEGGKECGSTDTLGVLRVDDVAQTLRHGTPPTAPEEPIEQVFPEWAGARAGSLTTDNVRRPDAGRQG